MASTYLTRNPGSAGNRQKWTFSAWVKRASLGASQAMFTAGFGQNNVDTLKFTSTDRINWFSYDGNTDYSIETTRKFRDVNAWYHIQAVLDTTNATTNDRVIIYVNGERETSLATNTMPSQNYNGIFNNNSTVHYIGRYGWNSNEYFDGEMSHVHFSDGYALAPTIFGSTDSTTGEWKINTSPSFTPGTNGFTILKDGNTITDQSSNSNDFTLGGGTLTKTEDNPSNVFCCLNRLQTPKPGQLAMSYGNTRVTGNDSAWQRSYGTIGANSGKWWYELYLEAADTSSRIGWDSIDRINMGDDSYYSGIAIKNSGIIMGGIEGTNAYSPSNVQLPADGGGNATWSQGDYMGMGIDLDNNTITIYKNGSALATNWSYASYNTSLKTSTYGTFVAPSVSFHSSSGNGNIYQFNFGNGAFAGTQLTGTTYQDSNGQGVFKYQPPTNYLAFCTKNLNV